jgi:hypothetical protein
LFQHSLICDHCIQFEQPGSNRWQSRKCNSDEDLPIVVTSAASDKDPSLAASETHGGDDDDDLEIHEWSDPESQNSDQVNVVENQLKI